jgi:hypothetical protein
MKAAEQQLANLLKNTRQQKTNVCTLSGVQSYGNLKKRDHMFLHILKATTA